MRRDSSRGRAEVLIRPPVAWVPLSVHELWGYRDLLAFLVKRDVKVRYAQAAIGVGWAVLQPILMTALFAIILGRLAKVPSEGLPYAVFALTGLIPWTYFASATGDASQSLVSNSNLVSKVYFPRVLVPLAALLSWLPDVVISSVLLVIVMAVYGLHPGILIFALPVFVGLTVVIAASVTIWSSALNVAYRDVRYAIPFVLQLWMFATPVVFPATLVPPQWRVLLGLNPMAGAVEGFRWVFLGTRPSSWALMIVSLGVSLVLLLSGLYYFRRVEQTFADVI